ncbi:ParB/RepB/Spo0J family partition protein [Aureimonas sp. D3]|uniref:ParB/RepB/Spo0J family partition protein n=1 Tax=Aureimonas sp. D3 TaxID=1638164 RepID=UPI000786170D|nr:ParB/RepB/Spo0J family partition protein [Aureimonas sp. D3]
MRQTAARGENDLDAFGELVQGAGRSRRAIALDRLARLSSPTTGQHPTKLPVAALRTDPDAFSVRGASLADWHLGDLTAALKSVGPGGDLDPILVIPAGRTFVVVDGHYRLEVYRRFGRSDIPVEVFQGTPPQALLEASRRAGKVALVLDNRQRQDLAWDLTRAQQGYSIREVAGASGVSEAQVSNMRAALVALGDEGLEVASWRHAFDLAKGREYSPVDLTEEELEAKARDAARIIRKAIGPRLQASPEFAAYVFRDLMGHRIGDCMSYLDRLGCVPTEDHEEDTGDGGHEF